MAGGNKGATLQTRLKGNILSYPVAAATKIYRGAAATLDKSAGGASHDITAADHNPFIGMSEEYVDNTGALGVKNVRLRRHGIFRFEFGRADPTSGIVPAPVDFSDTTEGCTVSEGAAGLTVLTYEASAAIEYLAGDFIVIAGVTDVLGAPHMNGTWRVYSVASQVVNIYKAYEACTAKLVVGTSTYYKSVPAATDLGKTAFLGVAQQAAVEEQVWALQGVEPVDLDRVLLGPIVKVEAAPDAFVWIDIVTGALRGCSLEFTTSVTDICVVESIVTFVGGT